MSETTPTTETSANKPSAPISLTARAAARISAVVADQGRAYLRLAVDGGGCSGFSYVFDFADAPEPDDALIERDGAKVLIDEASMEFLAGSEIDYVDELIGASFKVNNPNAKSSCGCGMSFNA